MVMRGPRRENPTSISFLGLRDRCQYRQVVMGVGRTTPAVYAACQMFSWWTRRVTSRMSTGARRLDRSFLWTQRKLISAMRTTSSRARMRAGTPEMKATSFLDSLARTPMCQARKKEGGRSAQRRKAGE
ncbi:Os01g0708201 [Oryza sativa Japonica Group]|uniref:Os01g0708201 protein n=1 Tax=Oryza sativa subsp. japonica TaxID=39947 RepID=A0A0P0V775_ORYSJ|nr:hypothetical protein EE612_005276 [Oryza sativa]BAS73954.1 Os01g0708201 [Oryza sativa Japonica Group]